MALIYGSVVGIASGGTVSKIEGYNIHTFDKVGLNTFTSLSNGYVEVLVVGGGAAGSAQTGGSGGGGGGSVLYQRFIQVTAGVSYPVFVGAGGTNGSVGTDSTVGHAGGTIISYGGDVGIGSYGLLPLTPNSYTRTVGQTVTFNSTSMLANGTTLYYDITGASTSDFTDGILTGTTTVSNGAIVPISKTITGTGNKSFGLNLRQGSNSGQIISTLQSPIVIPQATVTFSSIPFTIDEGASGTFNVTTTNVENGTTLYWTINNQTTNSADFTSTSGSFTITSNAGSFSVPIATNLTVEGAETFTVSVRIGGTSGTTVATSSAVTIPAKTYTFSSVPATINESSGTSGNFTLTTTNVTNGTTLFWTIDNISTVDADFTSTSGSFTITSNSGTFSVPIATDATLEGAETFRVQVRYLSITGEIVANSASVTISAASVTFSSTPSTINEGASGTFNVTTNSISNGHTLFWTINNVTTLDNDFGAISGSFTITSNAGSFSVPIATNLTVEGAETFTVSVRDGSTSGAILVTSASVTIPAKTYTFSSVPATINEGASGTFNVTTVNVTNGTTLFWTVEHGTTDSADFGSTSGSFTITSNAGSFSVPVATNLTVEGAETFTVKIRYLSITGEVVATSSTVTIPAKTYTFTLTPTVINESTGTSGNFTLTTTNVTNGTTLFWTVLNGTTVDADFTSTSGSFTINSNTGTFSVPIASDAILEGAETFSIRVRYLSITGEIVATSSSVTISAATVTFGSIPSSINEGASGTFNVTTNSISNGHTLFWTINHITTDSSDFTSTSGSFTITSNAGSFSVPIANDLVNDSSETFTVSVRDLSISGTVYATSASVTINDLTFVTTASTTSLVEGTSVVFTTNAAYANGTILYYDITGSAGIAAADFTSNSLSGTYNVLSGFASTTLTPVVDGTLENSGLGESFQLNIRTSPFGPYISTSPTVTIFDGVIINSRASWTSNATIGQNAILRGTSNTVYSLAVAADPSAVKSIKFPVTWPSSSFVSNGQNQITPFTMGASDFSIMSDVSHIFATGSFGVAPISGASESCCDPYGMNFGGITIFSALGSRSNTYQKITGFSGSFTSNSGNVTYSTDGSVNGGNGLVGAAGTFYLS